MKDFQLSKNFSFFELTKTSDFILQNQNRQVGLSYQVPLKTLATGILQPIRDYWQKPAIISSGFRCQDLNQLIGGSPSSQHTRGEAADFILKDMPCQFVFENLATALPSVKFGQFIWEKKEDKEWLHISLPTLRENMQMLIFEKGAYRKV